MRFCQIDGTPLVDETENAPATDPFKTIAASQNEGGSSVPSDENKTVFDGASIREEKDRLPKDSDSSEGYASEKEPEINDPFSPESPKFDLNPVPDSSSSQSPFNAPTPGYQPPFKEPHQNFGEANAPFSQNPFEQSQNKFGQPMQQSQWTPPPAPEANWQNQNIGANTPFQPPVVQGQNQTLPIVSLVLGIISVVCCGMGLLLGPAALVTGYMGKNNANNYPEQYGGSGMALAGMITGGIGTLISIGYFILIIIGAIASPR
jgi:hypothetical protein